MTHNNTRDDHDHTLTMRILSRVWGKMSGYVFLPTLDRKTRAFTEHVFSWPGDREQIDAHIRECDDTGVEQYFTPGVYSRPSRKAEHLLTRDRAWADLDRVDPVAVTPAPAFVWETSPGSYQCVWLLSEAVTPERWAAISKYLTDSNGADRGGWNASKLLRVPGTVNNKPQRAREGTQQAPRGVVRRARTSLVIDASTLPVSAVRRCPTPGSASTGDVMTALGVRVRGISRGHRFKANNPDGSRYLMLARIESEMFRKGYSARDIYDTLRGTVSDKWDNDHKLAEHILSARDR